MKILLQFIFILMTASLPVMAQEEELGTDSAPSMGDVPLDGGLSLLLAAGAAYGGRRLYKKDRKKLQQMKDPV